jgi:membrane protein
MSIQPQRTQQATVDEGAPPESPLDLPASGWRATLRRTMKETKDDRISMTAAGVAFYWFLSIFPLLFAAIGLLTVLKVNASTVSGINKAITTALPGDAASILVNAVGQSQSRAAGGGLVTLIVGVALAIWSASAGMAAVQVGLDVAYDVPKDRTFLKKRLVGIVLVFVALVLMGAATALLVFGQPLGVFFQKQLPGGGYFVWAWTVVRWVLTILAVITLFAVFYYIGPNRKPPNWKWISPGGLVAAVIWLVGSLGFSFYVSTFGGTYAKTYGALAGVVVLVLWLYLASLALLLGAELNGELERQRRMEERRSASGEEKPDGAQAGVPPPLTSG